MKKILFLLLPLIPALALAQTGTVKDSVRVLTTAEIQAGQASDTANFYFIQNGQWRKINMDSLDSFLRRKRAGDRGDIDVSTDGLTWTVDTNAIVAVDIQNGAVDSTKLALGAVVLPGAKVTGTLPVSKGGTGTETQFTAGSVVFAGAGGVYSQNNSGLFWDNANGRLGINTASPAYKLDVTGNIRSSETVLVGNGASQTELRINSLGGNNQGPFIRLQKGGSNKGYIGTFSVIINGTSDDLTYYATGSQQWMTNNSTATKMLLDASGNLGIGTTPAVQFHTTGGVRFAGLATSGTSTYTVKADASGNLWYDSSDESYKKNISTIPYGIESIMQLNPVAYNFVEDDEPDLGFIAQDVYDVIPELTYTAQDGKFGVKYDKLVSVLTKAIQEQQAQIEVLKARITQLENK